MASMLPGRHAAQLWSPPMRWWVWLPIAAIGALHYTTSAEHVWVHNVLRRLYYLPILFAAFNLGRRGGLLAAAVVSLTYLPHAFLRLGHMAHSDPAGGWDKALEIVLYNVVGLVAGHLADLEWRRRAELQAALDEQHSLRDQLVLAGRLSSLGEVVAGIAHEVKNPLHSLQGTAEIIDPLIPTDAEERRMWEIHVSELHRLQRIADRFLSFASPRPLNLGPLDLREVANRLVELASADARKRGVRLTTRVPSNPVMVAGDRDQLAQVALNITLNALRAIGERGGQIALTVAAGERAVQPAHRLMVENSGPPIADQEMAHLYDPFHSGDAEGTGLGLSIAARIVEQHGGSIDAANAGLGVRFTITLPALRR